MLNITTYWRNANKNYNEVLPHTSQNDNCQKVYEKINAREGLEKRNTSTLLVGMQIGATTMEDSIEVP